MQAQQLLSDTQNTIEANGITVRKGSVGAFLISWRTLQDTASDAATRQQAEQDLHTLLPALRALGLFDVFSARDPALQALIDAA
ncbi:hypothetical protein SAMN02745857_00850 [Andreprevotia lacus DSM 23236]|jgi:hypothetical protein|uniref:Preprotein translocase subunit SecD n=1 Tax=Andreprevotia lacus DSM 23236 TaxID=1121001 RepID=A0A1W1X878_9NEIS|nr:hypothetical protein [Andreprevotia lacus]SMC20185.1 hypothetical protein SAMN02745857_00850 [Andreprevotia lacus DSM 23236]